MGIVKFRTFEEAEQALWTFTPDHAYFERIRELFDVAQRLRPTAPKPGIQKFRSIEEHFKDSSGS